MHDSQRTPYAVLGTHLKRVREQSNESVAEVSGAVEIDAEALERIEAGAERPSEDILMLLINHFNIGEQDAVSLWESAGYEGDERSRKHINDLVEKTPILLLAMDARTVYSDGLQIDANKKGLKLEFTQGSSPQLPVAKIGMSYEQAKEVITMLQHAVLYGQHGASQRRLPPADNQ